MNPDFIGRIKERTLLSKPGSRKETYHLVIDLAGSSLSYREGDCLAIHPQNDPHLVASILFSLGFSGQESILLKDGTQSNLESFLLSKANLGKVGPKLRNLLMIDRQEGEVADLLLKVRPKLQPQEFADALLPLLPRYYSIASSMAEVGMEAHLTIALASYTTLAYRREGTCTHYLCREAPLGDAIVPLSIHPAKQFSLPQTDETPIIMVGPGTGIAPFRAFMQKRCLSETAKSNWLFFGEWNAAFDFYYQSYWEECQKSGYLRVDTAFSRDQTEKIYVQDRLLAKSTEVWRWLEEGASFYICGDAKQMARSVEKALVQIIMDEGAFSAEDAKKYIQNLKKENRFQKDVY